jgi:GDP-4-dehydro-6-deoxy-D-mannose reductase
MATTPMRALVTGANGFLGRHVVTLLRSKGAEVVTTGREDAAVDVAGDLRDATFASRLVAASAPTHVFHLAGTLGDAPPFEQLDVNVVATCTLLDAIAAGDDVWLGVASSSAVYGAPAQLPIREDHPLAPLTPYAASKASQEMAVLTHELATGAPMARARLFNLVGPGQPPSLLLSGIARQVARAEAAGGGDVSVGNVEPRRDFVDVRDAAAALVALADDRASGAFNVATGASISVRDAVDVLVGLAGCPVRVVVDDDRRRAVEIPDQVGDFGRLTATTGWVPTVPFLRSAGDLLVEWRDRIGGTPT